MEMVVARDVARPAGAGTHRPQRFLHRRQHRRVLAHAEIVVRAPDGDLGTDPVIKCARKLAATPLEVGEHAVASLSPQRLETLFEEPFVVHRRRTLNTRHRAQSELRKAARSAFC